MAKIVIPIRITPEMVERIDAQSQNRSKFILEAIAVHLQRIEYPKPKPIDKVVKHAIASITGSEPKGEWNPISKCRHGWQNAFVCERNHGGCNQ